MVVAFSSLFSFFSSLNETNGNKNGLGGGGWSLSWQKVFCRLLPCMVACQTKCWTWSWINAKKIKAMQIEVKMNMLWRFGRQEKIKKNKQLFGALTMANSHVSPHHHPSWLDSSAKWARRALDWPELLSSNEGFEWAIDSLAICFPFLKSLDDWRHQAGDGSTNSILHIPFSWSWDCPIWEPSTHFMLHLAFGTTNLSNSSVLSFLRAGIGLFGVMSSCI